MKKCQTCGYDNEDQANFCLSCGTKLLNVAPNESFDFNPNNDSPLQQPENNQNFEPQNNQQISQQQFNNQQNTYQGQNYNVPSQKNVALAVLLDVIGGILLYFLSGIGQLYLGLYKRGIVLCVIGLLITLINIVIILSLDEIVGPIITLILGIALVAYSAYDAYQCANAINEGRPIPLLFGSIDIQ